MNCQNFIKKFALPAEFKAPDKLEFEDLIAKPLTRKDLKADLAAVNSSIEVIKKTHGGSWPEKELSEDFDLLDLAWHECEFRDSRSFAYAVYDASGQYIGCFYLYPIGHRMELTDELDQYDADVSWWVTAEAYDKGYYGKLYTALQGWLNVSFPFANIYFSNKEIPS